MLPRPHHPRPSPTSFDVASDPPFAVRARFPRHGTTEEYDQHKPLFHMKAAAREVAGRELTPEEETRVENRYVSSLGNPTPRQFTEQQAIEHSGSRADSLPRAMVRGAYQGLTSPIAAFDPQEAELIRHEANVAVPVAPSTKTQIGEIAGGLAPVTAAAVTGNPEAVPMFLAAHGATSGVGTARTEAMQQREAGKPVSVAQETKAALGDAAIGGAGGYAAGTVLGATEAIPSVAGRIGANVGVNATMGAGQQAGENFVAQQTIDPNRKIGQGVGRAAVVGGAQGLAFSGVGEAARAVGRALSPQEQRAQEIPPQGDQQPVAAEAAPESQPRDIFDQIAPEPQKPGFVGDVFDQLEAQLRMRSQIEQAREPLRPELPPDSREIPANLPPTPQGFVPELPAPRERAPQQYDAQELANALPKRDTLPSVTQPEGAGRTTPQEQTPQRPSGKVDPSLYKIEKEFPQVPGGPDVVRLTESGKERTLRAQNIRMQPPAVAAMEFIGSYGGEVKYERRNGPRIELINKEHIPGLKELQRMGIVRATQGEERGYQLTRDGDRVLSQWHDEQQRLIKRIESSFNPSAPAESGGIPTSTEQAGAQDVPPASAGVSPVQPPSPESTPTSARVAPAAASETKQPWEMTRKEFATTATVSRGNNFIAVESPHDGSDFVIRSLETSKYSDSDAIGQSHRDYVKTAIRAGKPVPPEVLADYPDLAPPAQAPAQRPTGEKPQAPVQPQPAGGAKQAAKIKIIESPQQKVDRLRARRQTIAEKKANPPDLTAPANITARRAQLQQQLRDTVITEMGMDYADQPSTSPHVIAAMRGEKSPGHLVSLEGALKAAEEAPEGHPAKLVLHNLRELEKNPRGTKFQTFNTSDLQPGERVQINPKEIVTWEPEEGPHGTLRDGVTAEVPEGGMQIVGTKKLPPDFKETSDDFFSADEVHGAMTESGVAPEAAKESVKKLVAFHGSPHEFEQFDSSKIGTGEGAQAFGHGLYFAGAKEVAEHYKQTN
jgi:hypothetical protein